MGCTYEPSLGCPTHTMVCVLPLLDTDIIYCISFVNTERMWCYLFIPFVCSSSAKAKLNFLLPDLDIPHQQEAMCLCLTWGGAFPHHSWEKGNQASSPRAPHVPGWLSLGNSWEQSPEEQQGKGAGLLPVIPHPMRHHQERTGAEQVRPKGGGKTTTRALLSNVVFSHRLGSMISEIFSKLTDSVMLQPAVVRMETG